MDTRSTLTRLEGHAETHQMCGSAQVFPALFSDTSAARSWQHLVMVPNTILQEPRAPWRRGFQGKVSGTFKDVLKRWRHIERTSTGADLHELSDKVTMTHRPRQYPQATDGPR